MRKQTSIPEELVRAKAYEIWKKRQHDRTDGNPYDDWNQSLVFFAKYRQFIWLFILIWKVKSSRSYASLIQRVIAFHKTKCWRAIKPLTKRPKIFFPILLIEKLLIEPFAHFIDRLDIFRIFEKIGFLLAILIFLLEFPQRRDKSIFEAWDVIKDGKNQKSGAVKIALEKIYKEDYIFSGTDVSGSNLSRINLACKNKTSCADLSNVNLSNSDLSFANLSGANLSGANLSGANLRDVNLNNADLETANLDSANLASANLTDACFISANLSNSKLWGANLNRAVFWDANLANADFFKSISAKEADFTYSKNFDRILK